MQNIQKDQNGKGGFDIDGFEGYLFDLDGVIIDSEKIYTDIWSEIDRRYPTGIENFALKIKGTTLDSILGTYYPEPETRSRVEALLYELEAQIDYQIIDGAQWLLDYLKKNGKRTALVTSSNEIKMGHLWSQHPELKDYFCVILTADDITKSKPNPEGYLKAASIIDADPHKCVVIEDSLQGVMAGEAAGGGVIGVAGTLPAETLKPHCDIVVTDLRQLNPES